MFDLLNNCWKSGNFAVLQANLTKRLEYKYGHKSLYTLQTGMYDT